MIELRLDNSMEIFEYVNMNMSTKRDRLGGGVSISQDGWGREVGGGRDYLPLPTYPA